MTTKEFDTKLINKRIALLENITQECLQDTHPEIDALYEQFLNGNASYIYISEVLNKAIELLNMD